MGEMEVNIKGRPLIDIRHNELKHCVVGVPCSRIKFTGYMARP